MRKIVLISFVILSAAVQMTHAQKQAVIKLTEYTNTGIFPTGSLNNYL